MKEWGARPDERRRQRAFEHEAGDQGAKMFEQAWSDCSMPRLASRRTASQARGEHGGARLCECEPAHVPRTSHAGAARMNRAGEPAYQEGRATSCGARRAGIRRGPSSCTPTGAAEARGRRPRQGP